MKQETVKEYTRKIEWQVCKDFNLPEMPACQGILIKHLIEHYKIPFKAVGYHMDIVGIRTNKQTMLWKDTGIGARFLGILDNATKEVQVPKPKPRPQNTQVFKSMKELQAEIKKRDYNLILDLKAEITEENYYYFLEVLPPLKMDDHSFILSEALSDNLYYKFFREANKYYCQVVELEDEEVIKMETY